MVRIVKYLVLLSLLIATGVVLHGRNSDTNSNVSAVQGAAVSQILDRKTETISKDELPRIIEPIAEFTNRITKKPFGIYITPQTSPVQPDKFAGYHTGVDVEYEGVIREVPVRAITAGKVVFSKFTSGYGGVMVLRHTISGEDLFVLYGHLDPKSMPAPRTHVNKGQIIGFLGEGKTEETDGARKHLHFAILKKSELDIRGYVKTEGELEGWYDPVEFYAELD